MLLCLLIQDILCPFPVPEPGTITMMSIGLILITIGVIRKRKN